MNGSFFYQDSGRGRSARLLGSARPEGDLPADGDFRDLLAVIQPVPFNVLSERLAILKFRRARTAIAFLTAIFVLPIGWYAALGNPQSSLTGISRVVTQAQPPAVAADGALRVAVFGDSLAYGIGATHPQVNGVVPLLFAQIAARHPRSSFFNLSHKGARMQDILQHQLPASRGAAQLVLVIAGGNDVQAIETPSQIASNETVLLNALKRRFPGAAIVVTDIPDVSLRPIVPRWAKRPFHSLIVADNRAFRKAALSGGARVLPLYDLSRLPQALSPGTIVADGLHPSDKGYRLLAQAIWSRCAPLFSPVETRASGLDRPRC